MNDVQQQNLHLHLHLPLLFLSALQSDEDARGEDAAGRGRCRNKDSDNMPEVGLMTINETKSANVRPGGRSSHKAGSGSAQSDTERNNKQVLKLWFRDLEVSFKHSSLVLEFLECVLELE
ncbi:Hypothetical predicted protein, partial [Scomber scombrus]